MPYVGKAEKRYLKSLESVLEDFCQSNSFSSLSELESVYGSAEEVAYNYISSVDTDLLMRRLRTAKTIRMVALLVLMVAFVAVLYHSIIISNEYRILQEQQVFFVESELITKPNLNNDK